MRRACRIGLAWLGIGVLAASASADTIVMKNGFQIEGKVADISQILEGAKPKGGEVPTREILLADDDMRWTYVSKRQHRSVITEPGHNFVRIKIKQRVAQAGGRLEGLGPIFEVRPWDAHGHRLYSFAGSGRRFDVVQGITEITPTLTTIEALQVQAPLSQFIWKTRIATSSIPREVLSQIILNATDRKNANDRLAVIRLYVEAERYGEAEDELQGVLEDFPDLMELKTQLNKIRDQKADLAIREIDRRRDVGQYQLADYLLQNFPSEGVAGANLVRVKEILDEHGRQLKLLEEGKQKLGTHLHEIADDELRERIRPIVDEIQQELTFHSLNRLADYLRLADDEKLTTDQKLALAITAWLLGTGLGEANLAVSESLYEVRNLVREYLRTEPHDHHIRKGIVEKLTSLEGSAPRYLAQLIAQLRPPLDPPPWDEQSPGLAQVTIPGLGDSPSFDYLLQVPPEYHPDRRYPCLVVLHRGGSTAEDELEWWAGPWRADRKMRAGQATRHGYIVIAPRWTSPNQRGYEFSAREHAVVLSSLRDACRRFSIDTDRVFLAGHSMGGDAAWDIAQAHPDLWAGVIPIVATAGKYINHYWENARLLPLYFVGGRMDNTNSGGSRTAVNAEVWNRYLTKHTFDTTVVEYQGRGHESYSDEIQRIFDWMKLHERNFFPKQFKAESMRPWDSFFWFADCAAFPEKSMVVPGNWSDSKPRPATIEGNVHTNNRVTLKTSATRVTVWLAPELVDFQRPIEVVVGSKTYKGVKPSEEVLLEDARARADRRHPFWAKVTHPAR